ncbi:MAG: dTDP-4-dehydrorhamnose reductase [Oscillospiraceae bacterium]|nr:dTDP-4-dehydrorhamnose reductase [Oscillospiraceae bacterium]
MKIFVTGVTGQLGYDVKKELLNRGHEVICPTREELDLTDMNSVFVYMDEQRPNAVIHCAAYTAVDKAQKEANLCHDVNSSATRILARNCSRLGIPMLYVSTDYVFDGSGNDPFEIDSKKGPLNEYGLSKLAGEEAVRTLCSKYFIVRTSWVFGMNGGNFVKTILRIADTKDRITVVHDQTGSPTFTEDLAPLLCDIIVSDKYGVYHATNEGFCTFCEFAQKIIELSGRHTKIIPITTAQYNAPARRPLNSRLSKQSLVDAGFNLLPRWEDALARFLKEYEK